MAEREKKSSYSRDSSPHTEHVSGIEKHSRSVAEIDRANAQAIFENPLAHISKDDLMKDVDDFCQKYDLMEYVQDFRKGALVCQSPHRVQEIEELSESDINALEREHTHKWSQPFMLYWLVTMCSLAAAVQGMDETVNNGAQNIYLQILNITPRTNAAGNLIDGPPRFDKNMQDNLTGLIVGAPYLACALLGCWLTEPLNYVFARRGTIFISCLIAAVASVWEGVSKSWVNLFIARFVLGLGIGSKSTTVPVYSAECSPAPIRGALVMMWQMWTAFGIMLGNIIGVAFAPNGDTISYDLSWRLMLGSTVVLPVFVCAQVYFCPESPRWLIQHGHINQAFRSFQTLRPTNLQAARDLYYAHVGVKLERQVNSGKNFFVMFAELFTIPRNRRATLATWIVMFMQQFCGVNVIAYYSTTIFIEGGYSESNALLASMGTGILNFVFAIPAFFTIDTWGRRNLLLFTFPFLAIFLLWTGMSFFIDPPLGPNGQPDYASSTPVHSSARTGMITTGMYLFEVFYSPGEGPVPFTYSAESFPLHVRDVGMSWATATTWSFNFILSFTWPHLVTAFKPQGAFAWYAGWCVIGWFLVLLFMPETKALTLEELDQVFSVPTWKHASYQIKNASWHFRRYVLLQRRLEPLPPFYQGAEALMEL